MRKKEQRTKRNKRGRNMKKLEKIKALDIFEGVKEETLEKITQHYLTSGDFNGITKDKLGNFNIKDLEELILEDKIFVLCMKGIEITTGRRLSQIVSDGLDNSNNVAVWLGPGHIQEFTNGKPNCMVIDSVNKNLVKELADRGEKIRLLLRSDSPVFDNIDCEKFMGDVTNLQSLEKAFEGADTVYHVAGVVDISGTKDKQVWSVNYEGTKNVVAACKKMGVKTLIYVSSVD